MALALSILYRGPLSGCNYDCAYCPFAKRTDDRETLAADRASLRRFAEWVEAETAHTFKILFTPWGEALIHDAYREAMTRLSHLPHVSRVAIQTNLSCSVEWMASLDRVAASLWCSYHPSQAQMSKFVAKCTRMSELGVRYSVGAVGIPQNLDELRALKHALPPDVYMWINAHKGKGAKRYQLSDIAAFRALDPHFDINNKDYPSRGELCAAGEKSITVDGDGNIRRCHFIDGIIGNIYDAAWTAALKPRTCTRLKCDCHIGYANLEILNLDPHFNDWALGRVP